MDMWRGLRRGSFRALGPLVLAWCANVSTCRKDSVMGREAEDGHVLGREAEQEDRHVSCILALLLLYGAKDSLPYPAKVPSPGERKALCCS